MNLNLKTYKDKLLILPLIEVSWAKTNKILAFKFGVLKWAFNVNFNF